jgi:hypothetical protein
MSIRVDATHVRKIARPCPVRHTPRVTTAEALALLSLNENPSVEAINEAFRRLAAETHPDRGGDEDEFRRISEARDVLIAAQDGAALVPFREVRELMTLAMGGVAEREHRADLRDATRRVVANMVRIRVSPIRRARGRLTTMTFIAAIAAASSQALKIFPSGKSAWSGLNLTANVGTISFGVVAFLAAIGIAFYTYRISAIQGLIEDVDQTIDERATVVRLMREILQSSEKGPPVSTDDWLDAVRQWAWSQRPRPVLAAFPLSIRREPMSPHEYAGRVGPDDFAKLVYAKAKEHQVIAEHDEWNDDYLVVTFEFNRTEPGQRS